MALDNEPLPSKTPSESPRNLKQERCALRYSLFLFRLLSSSSGNNIHRQIRLYSNENQRICNDLRKIESYALTPGNGGPLSGESAIRFGLRLQRKIRRFGSDERRVGAIRNRKWPLPQLVHVPGVSWCVKTCQGVLRRVKAC